jgi:CHAT domain-containing protein
MLPDRSHLLSFLVDDDCTFAVLLAGDGSQYAERIDLSRHVLRAYAASVDPSTWGRSLGGFGSRVPADLPDRLAPLVSWLEPLLQKRVINAGDHLCYSPDDELHLIPLHLLTFAGGPLVETFSVSRLQTARTAADVLGRPASRPRAGCTFDVPAVEDDSAKAAAFRRTGDLVADLLPCDRLSGAGATLTALAACELSDRVVHFTTHGTFPKAQNTSMNQNPFYSSGLLLATGSGLPSLTAVAHAQSDSGVLSPVRLGPLRFARSHVTTQACSSGLSREGAGGDALGIELALLLCGASSVLTTHWDVPLGPSGEFCERFYQGWLGPEHLTRAQAWRRAALSMKDEGRPPYEWAAFSLAGDWR